jgi:hypothetical protein
VTLKPRNRTLATCAALSLASVALYAESLTFGFVRYDDQTVLLGHPALYDERSLSGSVHEIFSYFPREEPLLVRDLSWAVDSRLFGLTNALGYHLGNVVLNAGNGALLFLFLQHATRRFVFAATVAALWVCLPLHVEPVCWVMGRKDMLTATFSLLMLWMQSLALAPARSAMPAAVATRRRRLFELGVLALYPLAVLSKFSAVAMVGALAVQRTLAEHLAGVVSPESPVDWRVARRRVAGLWPHALVGGALYIWYGKQLAQFGVTARGPGLSDLRHLGLVAARVPLVFGSYLRNVFTASRHAIFYDWPSAGIALTRGEQLLSLSLALTALGLLGWAAKRRKDLLFFALVGLVLMTTYLNLVYIGIWVADRYVYLTSFCLLALVVRLAEDRIALVNDAARRRKAQAIGWAAVLLYAAFGIRATLAHEPAFQDASALWAYEAARSTPSMLALQAYAKTFVVQAEASTDETERARLTGQASAALDRATARYQATPWEPIGRYVIDAHAQYGTVLILRGRVAALAGESDEAQLGYYREALRFAGTWVAALMIEQILYRQADQSSDEARAKEALHYFGKVVTSLVHDPARRQSLRDKLELGYRARFPSLAPSIDKIEKRSNL